MTSAWVAIIAAAVSVAGAALSWRYVHRVRKAIADALKHAGQGR